MTRPEIGSNILLISKYYEDIILLITGILGAEEI